MGDKTPQTIERHRMEVRSLNSNGVLVDCKCPYCGIIHKERMKIKPLVMPRRYCDQHRRFREEG